MRTFLPDLQFKGDRNYLHGTDAYCSILEAASDEEVTTLTRIRLRLHRVAERQVTGFFGATEEFLARDDTVFAEALLTYPESTRMVRLCETSSPVLGRYPYDEEAIVSSASVESLTISGARSSGQNGIETIVALTKKLHYSLFPPTGRRVQLWMFSGLDLTTLPSSENAEEISIVHQRQIGVRLSRSKVQIGSQDAGSIDFSLVDR